MANNLTLLGAGSSGAGAPLVWEKSLLLDGVNEQVDFGNVLDQDGTDPFTFALWVKPVSISGSHSLVSKLDQTSPFPGYELNILAAGNLDFIISNNASTNWARRQGTVTLSTGTWYHLIFTYDGSKDVTGLKWYINNAEETGYTTVVNTLTGSTTSPVNLYAGCRDGSNNFTNGNFKELYFWPSVISSGVRAEVYASGGAVNGAGISNPPTQLWRLGDTPGDDATGTTGQMQDTGSTGGITGTPINTEVGDLVDDAP